MSDQEGLKGGDINTAFKWGNLEFMEIFEEFPHKNISRDFQYDLSEFREKGIFQGTFKKMISSWNPP